MVLQQKRVKTPHFDGFACKTARGFADSGAAADDAQAQWGSFEACDSVLGGAFFFREDGGRGSGPRKSGKKSSGFLARFFQVAK